MCRSRFASTSPAAAVWFVAGMPDWSDTQRVFIPANEIMVVFTAEKMRGLGFDDVRFLHSSN